MNLDDFDNDNRISLMGKAAFFIVMIIALISLLRSAVSILSFIFIVSIFLLAYGKELINPYLNNKQRLQLEIGSLGISFVKLFIIVLRAKGQFTKHDLDILENYFTKEYNKEVGKDVKEFARKNFYLNFNQEFITNKISKQIKVKDKIQLISQLFHFCEHNGGLKPGQKKIISQIAKGIKLNTIYYQSIEDKYTQKQKNKKKQDYRQYRKSTCNLLNQAYHTLGLSSTVSNDVLRKTYRKLAKKHHPDKWHRNSMIERKKAKEKFQKINQAYSIIKKSRNLK